MRLLLAKLRYQIKYNEKAATFHTNDVQDDVGRMIGYIVGIYDDGDGWGGKWSVVLVPGRRNDYGRVFSLRNVGSVTKFHTRKAATEFAISEGQRLIEQLERMARK